MLVAFGLLVDFKNVDGLEEMLGMCCEGNDSELDYCYLNEEYGMENMIDEWGSEIFESYSELFNKLKGVDYWEYESNDWGKFRFELDKSDLMIKVIFKD
jgi:hypothetical protein